MRRAQMLVLTLALAVALVGCATTGEMGAGASYDKPGFATKVVDGRLWVFRSGSKEWEVFQKHGEPATMVTRIAAGPNGMTVRSHDAKVIDEYLAAK
jgi:hypothetical protein